MEHYRRTAHTRFDIKYHLVWITKYRKKLLRADVAIRLRQLVRDICSELEVDILKGHVSQDHVHLFVSCPPHVSPSYLMPRIKGKSSRKLLQQFSHLNKLTFRRSSPQFPGIFQRSWRAATPARRSSGPGPVGV
jgi:putative transposase